MKRVGVRTHILTATLLLVVAMMGVVLWSAVSLTGLGDDVGDGVDDHDEAAGVISDARDALEREDDALRYLYDVGVGVPAAKDALAAARLKVDDEVTRVDAVLTRRGEHAHIDFLRAPIGRYRVAADRVAGYPTGATLAYHGEVNPLLRVASGAADHLREHHFEVQRRVVRRARAEARSVCRIAIGLSLGVGAVAVVVMRLLGRRVVDPLRPLTEGARAIATGNFDARVPLGAGDEYGELAAAFNDMAARIAAFRLLDMGELSRVKKALEATIEALPDAVFVFDAARRLLSANGRARALLGLKSPISMAIEELAVGGVPLLDVLGGAGGAKASMDADHADLAKSPRVAIDGADLRLRTRVVPVNDLDGGKAGTIVVLYDVTALAHLEELHSDLLAAASHEMSSPLARLVMPLLLLQESAKSLPAAEREMVSLMASSVTQLRETVAELLDLSRIEGGELRLKPGAVEVDALIEEAIARAAPDAKSRRVNVVVRLGPVGATLHADRARLRIVLDNLISNAIKYTPPGREVRVTATARGGAEPGVRIEVADSGPGVPAKYWKRVFERFFRVEDHEPGMERGVRGVGIGLYLSAQIVALHGGTLRCEGGEGEGARFVLELPMG